jgi:hypothetical protein
VNIDGSPISDTTRLRILREMETEGQLVAPPFDKVEEVERLCAADLVMMMRSVREKAPHWDELTREKFARRLDRLIVEASAGAAYLRRHRASTDVPEWLRQEGAL